MSKRRPMDGTATYTKNNSDVGYNKKEKKTIKHIHSIPQTVKYRAECLIPLKCSRSRNVAKFLPWEDSNIKISIRQEHTAKVKFTLNNIKISIRKERAAKAKFTLNKVADKRNFMLVNVIF